MLGRMGGGGGESAHASGQLQNVGRGKGVVDKQSYDQPPCELGGGSSLHIRGRHIYNA